MIENQNSRDLGWVKATNQIWYGASSIKFSRNKDPFGHASKQKQKLAVALYGVHGTAFYRSCGLSFSPMASGSLAIINRICWIQRIQISIAKWCNKYSTPMGSHKYVRLDYRHPTLIGREYGWRVISSMVGGRRQVQKVIEVDEKMMSGASPAMEKEYERPKHEWGMACEDTNHGRKT